MLHSKRSFWSEVDTRNLLIKHIGVQNRIYPRFLNLKGHKLNLYIDLYSLARVESEMKHSNTKNIRYKAKAEGN